MITTTTLGELPITHIATHNRILNKRHYPTHTRIRILPDGTGWLLRGGEWVAATFYVKDILQRLELQDKLT